MPTATQSRPTLAVETAADMMSGPVASISGRASFSQAVAFFIDQNVTVAPVVGDQGEPVGVLSVVDLLIHVRESVPSERIVSATVVTLMTPTLFSVTPDTPASLVIQDMLRSKVHHLFVTDADGRILGVVSACDVLRHLQ